MAVDDGFKIAGKVPVERGSGSMFFGEAQRLGKQTYVRFSRANYGYGELAALDHDYCTRAHSRQQPGEVAGSFRFRDVDDMVSHGLIILSFSFVTERFLRQAKFVRLFLLGTMFEW